ncbi:MAG TPA: hypothetical protein VHC95_08850 [Opitutales bacterium]|nr:hypothetical protein [Opitutales bacterium]
MKAAKPSWNPLARWPWLWFVAAFAALLAAWTVLFVLAAKHPTADVVTEPAAAAPAAR